MANCLDALCKARNSRFLSLSGLKEHIVAYLQSGKSTFVSDILSQSGKGTRMKIESILKESVDTCKFKNPEGTSLFISFDNIQKLYKTNRLTEHEQQKVYAIIVCSLLAVLPEGFAKNDIQFKSSNSPSSWLFNFEFDSKTKSISHKLDVDILKAMIRSKDSDEKILNEYWRNDLEQELEAILSDFNEDNIDSIDILIQNEQNKRIRLCSDGHRNVDVRKNRKKCAIAKCNAYLLDEDSNDDSYFIFDDNQHTNKNNPENESEKDPERCQK